MKLGDQITVDEFRLMRNPPGMRLELHDGVTVPVPIQPFLHSLIGNNLMDILDEALDGEAWIECPFRPKPEYDMRAANVGWICSERACLIDPDDNLYGPPDLAIEINAFRKSAEELNARQQMFFDFGCPEFWLVEAAASMVLVTSLDGATRSFGKGESIPFRGAQISVDQIFKDHRQDLRPQTHLAESCSS